MTFKEWLVSETFQISRTDFQKISASMASLKMNWGVNARPGTDITKGDFGVKTSDPQRLVRIFIWGLKSIRDIESNILGAAIPLNRMEVNAGKFDNKIAPTLKQLIHVVDSMLVNFQQVGYQHSNTEAVSKLLQPYRGNI